MYLRTTAKLWFTANTTHNGTYSKCRPSATTRPERKRGGVSVLQSPRDSVVDQVSILKKVSLEDGGRALV